MEEPIRGIGPEIILRTRADSINEHRARCAIGRATNRIGHKPNTIIANGVMVIIMVTIGGIITAGPLFGSIGVGGAGGTAGGTRPRATIPTILITPTMDLSPVMMGCHRTK